MTTIDPTTATTAAIPRVPADAAVDDVVALLREHGACIVEDRLSPETVARVRSEIDPLVASSSHGTEDFSGFRTRRTGALLSHSTAVHELALDELVVGVTRAFLAPWTFKVQLMLTQVIAIGPGETDQMLHRDRLAWGGFVPREIETQVNTMWALTDFTAENGATRVVPGSTTWPDERQATEDEVVQAEMTAGSVLLFTGSIIHGGGGNATDDVRIGINMDYCLDWLRQEENQYLSCPPEIARDFPSELADLIGYTGGGFTIGYWSDPHDPHERATKQAESAVGNDRSDAVSMFNDDAREKLGDGK